MNLTINDLATGKTRALIGSQVEYVGAGANPHHVLVRHHGERRVVGLPARWVDGLPKDEPAAAPPEPAVCPTCGRLL